MLTRRFFDAAEFAGQVHADHIRKDGTGAPYLAHLLAVAGLVLEYGGTEDEAIAALLHDSIEDRGVSLDVIRTDFGPDVADIVAGCTENKQPGVSWGDRKQAFIDRLEQADRPVKLVVAADKLHNVRSLARNYRDQGEAIWQRFNAEKRDILWFYEACAGAVDDTALGRDLWLAIDDLQAFAAEMEQTRCQAAGCTEPPMYEGWYDVLDLSGNKTGTVRQGRFCKKHATILIGFESGK